jgi:hypothetical protein
LEVTDEAKAGLDMLMEFMGAFAIIGIVFVAFTLTFSTLIIFQDRGKTMKKVKGKEKVYICHLYEKTCKNKTDCKLNKKGKCGAWIDSKCDAVEYIPAKKRGNR